MARPLAGGGAVNYNLTSQTSQGLRMDKVWPVQDAKARLSELLRAAENEPQQISFRGEPKFEVRLLPMTAKKNSGAGGLPRWWLNAPKIPEFKLPPRKREKSRKVF